MHLEEFIKEYREAKKEIRQKGKRKLLKVQEDPSFIRRQLKRLALFMGISAALTGHAFLSILASLISYFTNKER